MTDLRRAGPLFATLILVLAACGGSGGGTATTAPSSGSDAGSSQPAGAEPSVAAPSDASTASEPASGGGTAAGVCELVTTAELEQIIGLGSIKTEVLAGPPDTCDVQADGAPVAAWVLTSPVPPFVYDAYANDAGAYAVDGIGDKAAFNPNQRLLVVVKGDSLVSVAVYTDSKTEDEQLELMKSIAKAAAGRM